jgi:very-short-patch-repair endonuclease
MAPQLDQPLARLASRQHGVVSHQQLLELGLGPRGISARVRDGRLHHLHRGVFAVGHTALTAKSHWLAGVLALGPEAVLSHGSAGALIGLRPSSSRFVDVLIPHRDGHTGRRKQLRVHRTTSLPAAEATVVDRIPVTSWARTLLDMAPSIGREGLAKALERSEELQLFDFPTVAAVLAAHNGHHGIGRLRRALVLYEPRAKSELQRRFLELCANHGLPRPDEEADIGGHPVDFLWPVERLVVETDGWRFHRTRAAWARDREQDARLVLAGYTVLRPTWDDVTVNAAQTAERVAYLLAAQRGVGRLSESVAP